MNHAFGVSKKSSPYPVSSGFSPVLSSTSLWSVIYSELIFLSGFIFLRVDVQFQHHLLKRLSLFHCIVFVPLYCLCFFVKDELTVYVGYLIFFLIGNFLIVAKVICVGKKHNSLVVFRKFGNYILRSFITLFYQKGVLIEGYFKLKKPK